MGLQREEIYSKDPMLNITICSGYHSHHLKRPNISRTNLTWALWQIDLALETWIGIRYSKLKHGLALETVRGGGGA